LLIVFFLFAIDFEISNTVLECVMAGRSLSQEWDGGHRYQQSFLTKRRVFAQSSL